MSPGGLLPAHPDWSPARRRLYEAALTLFAEHGYHAVSVRDLANAMGQQPGALYGHVESKDHLLAELLAVGMVDHRDALVRAVAQAGDDPVAQLQALVRAHVRMHAELPALARVVNDEFRSLSPARQREMRAVRRESADVLIGIIQRGVAAGVFRAVEPALAMRAIAAMGVRVADWIADPPTFAVEDIVETFCDFAVRMLRD